MSYLDRPKLRLIQGAALLAIFLALGFGFLWNSDSQALALIQRNLKKADALVQSQNLPEAQSTFKEMLANVPMVYFAYQSRLELLDQARIDLAQLQIRQNQLTAARKSLEQVVSKTHQSQAEKIRNELDDGVKLKEADQLVATGHWYEAEKLYDRHLNLTKQSLQHRMLFHTVLIRQGRTVKARQTYADGVFALDHPEDGLASLWVMDVEEPVIGDWTASIEQAARLTPDDPRVRLAQTFLDRSAGRFQDARTLIDRLIAQRPDDRAVLQERLQLAMAEGDFSKALEISKQLKFTKAEANRMAAWLFQKADFISNEAECLKIVVQINPSDRPALSRLSEIAASQKLAKQAAEYQALKREAELRRMEYSKLCRKSSPLTPEIAVKLADTAARLGFVMDSWAWKTLAAGKALAYSEQPQEEFKLLMDWVELESLKPSVDKSAIALQPNLVDRNPIEFEDIAQGSGLAGGGGGGSPLQGLDRGPAALAAHQAALLQVTDLLAHVDLQGARHPLGLGHNEHRFRQVGVVAGFKGHQLFGAQPQPVRQLLQAEALITPGVAKHFAQMDKFRDRCAPVLCGHGCGRSIGQGQ
jgi:tetratricopeptide (TPR) repeat protein